MSDPYEGNANFFMTLGGLFSAIVLLAGYLWCRDNTPPISTQESPAQVYQVPVNQQQVGVSPEDARLAQFYECKAFQRLGLQPDDGLQATINDLVSGEGTRMYAQGPLAGARNSVNEVMGYPGKGEDWLTLGQVIGIDQMPPELDTLAIYAHPEWIAKVGDGPFTAPICTYFDQ